MTDENSSSKELYSESDEINFIKKLGHGIWYETKQISQRYYLLIKYINALKHRTFKSNISKDKIEKFSVSEKMKCENNKDCVKIEPYDLMYKYEITRENKCRNCK